MCHSPVLLVMAAFHSATNSALQWLPTQHIGCTSAAGWVVQEAAVAYGGVAAKTIMGPATAKALCGQPLTQETLHRALQAVAEDVNISANAPGGQLGRMLGSKFLQIGVPGATNVDRPGMLEGDAALLVGSPFPHLALLSLGVSRGATESVQVAPLHLFGCLVGSFRQQRLLLLKVLDSASLCAATPSCSWVSSHPCQRLCCRGACRRHGGVPQEPGIQLPLPHDGLCQRPDGGSQGPWLHQQLLWLRCLSGAALRAPCRAGAAVLCKDAGGGGCGAAPQAHGCRPPGGGLVSEHNLVLGCAACSPSCWEPRWGDLERLEG